MNTLGSSSHHKSISVNTPDAIIMLWSGRHQNFPDSIIINTKQGNRNISYAIRHHTSDTQLEWNMFELNSDGSIKYTQQLHDTDMIELWAKGILNAYQDALLAIRNTFIDTLKQDILTKLYLKADSFDPFTHSNPDAQIFNPIKATLQELTIDEQKSLADWFFSVTIGKYIGNNRNAYKIYYLFKWSPFAFRFSELEDARLKEEGYAGFTI